ncbi:MAG: alginate lyase family protein [Bacteroides sp.]|nr:alginate lyase family protein [Bacteroides sp.]
MGPYWWPDPSKPDGLPYIRKDGERNPELDKLDRNRLGNMAESVFTLGLAYFFSEEEKYAEKAVEYLKVWFLNPKTKMNPHLNFGQTIPGINNGMGRGVGIIDTYSYVKMLEGVELMHSSKALSKGIKEELKSWFADYVEWMITSPIGLEEDEAKNNHGLAYDVQVAVFAQFAGKNELTDKVLRNFPKRRLFTQIEPDGSQPLELERTTAFGYTVFNITHMLDISALGVKRGIDIYHQSSPDGRSITAAIRFIIPYIGKPKSEWPWQQIKEWNQKQEEACWILRRASFYDPEAGYEEISAQYRKTSPDSILHLLYSLE